MALTKLQSVLRCPTSKGRFNVAESFRQIFSEKHTGNFECSEFSSLNFAFNNNAMVGHNARNARRQWSIVVVFWHLQVEQVSKYTSSRPQRPLADAVVTRRLLEARQWKLICISEHDWVRRRKFEEKIAFLEEKIMEVVSAPPALKAL